MMDKQKKILIGVSAIVLLVWLLVSISEIHYLIGVKNGEVRYSVAEIKDHYYQGEVIGKIIEYSFRGQIYRTLCANQICKKSKLGERYFIKLYIDDPDVFDIVESKYDANKIVKVPYEGWRTIPVTKF